MTLNKARYVFIGNRKFVLEEMVAQGLDIRNVFAFSGSHLERQAVQLGLSTVIFKNKKELLASLFQEEFDVLVSNGCPYILPTRGYSNSESILVNIHPSFLPDLAGKDPVPGAIMHKRNSGATCHIIDEGIDTGPVISQILIPHSEDLDAGLLYQLSFLAEKQVFNMALAAKFNPVFAQTKEFDSIYYNRSEDDLKLDLEHDSPENIVQKIKAYGNPSRGVKFTIKSCQFIAYRSDLLVNPYLEEHANNFSEKQIVLVYDDTVVFKFKSRLVRLGGINNPVERITVGDYID